MARPADVIDVTICVMRTIWAEVPFEPEATPPPGRAAPPLLPPPGELQGSTAAGATGPGVDEPGVEELGGTVLLLGVQVVVLGVLTCAGLCTARGDPPPGPANWPEVLFWPAPSLLD